MTILISLTIHHMEINISMSLRLTQFYRHFGKKGTIFFLAFWKVWLKYLSFRSNHLGTRHLEWGFENIFSLSIGYKIGGYSDTFCAGYLKHGRLLCFLLIQIYVAKKYSQMFWTQPHFWEHSRCMKSIHKKLDHFHKLML